MPEKLEEFALILHETDNVAVLKRPIKRGTEFVRGSTHFTASRDIPAGHKIAIADIGEAQTVQKYGQVIGFAQTRIGAGDHVHTHNVAVKDFGRDYQFCSDVRRIEFYPPDQMRTFEGYARPGGRAGTRNYLAAISSVNCSASVSHYIADRFKTPEFNRDFPNVDGVIAVTHKSGCAMSPDEPTRVLQRVLAGVAKHPNISGYLLIGLGCEVNQVQSIVREYKLDHLQSGELRWRGAGVGPRYLVLPQ